jgi:AraC-like DNA-binding protein
MRYEARRPGPPLSAYVDRLWVVEGTPGAQRERVLPTGGLELLFNLVDAQGGLIYDPSGRAHRSNATAAIAGCYGTAFEYDTRVRTYVAGVHFKPGGAARLLGAPAGAFANLHVDLAAVWGRAASELRDRLCEAASSRDQFDVLERVLVARLPSRWQPRPAVTCALAELARPDVEVGSVARTVGLSRRRLIEVFSDDVGITPKRYAMVRRFQRALELSARSRIPSWSGIAVQAGYYDQPHLCRDWRELTGLSPQDFVARRGLAIKDNHVAVPDAQVKSVQDRSRVMAYPSGEGRK